MRVPPNKRHLVVNKEYSRLPYWTDDGFEDVQRQTSQKYVQDSFGAFPESENQLPYLSDADYQGLEYQYQNPEFFYPTDLPDVDIINTVPKGTCYDLWVSLFGSSPHGFFPTANEYAKLMEYTKKCPLIFMPHWCCSPSGMKISGPANVAPGANAEYTASGGLEGCTYTWDADRGRIVGGTYTAPDTSGSDRITVSPYLGSDMGKICASKDITIEGGCTGTVHATTPQMTVGASQALYIEGGSEGDTYHWSTTSGSLSPSTGTSVTYTAPAANANCTSNPTITVTCGGSTIGTLTIAVTNSSVSGEAYATGHFYWASACNMGSEGGYFVANVYGYKDLYSCTGSFIRRSALYDGGSSTLYGSCDAALNAGYAQLAIDLGTTDCWGAVTDIRTADQKAAGCCPATLL
jgi:hypothetical protein